MTDDQFKKLLKDAHLQGMIDCMIVVRDSMDKHINALINSLLEKLNNDRS